MPRLATHAGSLWLVAERCCAWFSHLKPMWSSRWVGAQSAQHCKTELVFIKRMSRSFLQDLVGKLRQSSGKVHKTATVVACIVGKLQFSTRLPSCVSPTSLWAMGSHAVAFTSSVLRGADATLKGDKNLESYSGFNKDWDDYTAWLFSHVDSRGLLLFFNHALHERIAIVSDGSVGGRSLYTQIGAVARRVLVVVVDVQARPSRAASSARDIDARSSGVGGGIGAQLSSGAGGSGGRLDVHAESPVVQRVRAGLGEDELDRVQVNAVFKHDTAEAARRAAVVGRLDSAWALQQFDTQEMTVNLKEWLQATRAIYRVLMYKAVPTVMQAHGQQGQQDLWCGSVPGPAREAC